PAAPAGRRQQGRGPRREVIARCLRRHWPTDWRPGTATRGRRRGAGWTRARRRAPERRGRRSWLPPEGGRAVGGGLEGGVGGLEGGPRVVGTPAGGRAKDALAVVRRHG